LHLDGLADCLDGLLGHDVEQRLAIMRDSRIGTFGAVGLVLFLMIEIVVLSELPDGPRRRLLLAAPAVARATPACLSRLFRPARTTGQGAAFASSMPGWAWGVGLVVAGLTAAATLGGIGMVGTLAAVGAAVVLARFLVARLGGITGDVLGAAVEMAELTLALTVSAWIHTRR
jgi:adenosylcobinamide-GDP ribazoletransferase